MSGYKINLPISATDERIPVTLEGKEVPDSLCPTRKEVYESMGRVAVTSYQHLISSGVPEEDAKQILPPCVEII